MKQIDELVNQIHLGKWEDVITQVPDNSVDIVITSPPYNISLGASKKSKKGAYDTYDDNLPYTEYLNWMDSLFTECHRILKVGGRIAVNIADGSNGSIMTHADFAVRLRDTHKFIPMTTIVWDKRQIGCSTAWGSYQSPSSPSFPTQFEFIIVMAKDTKKHEGDKSKITVGGKEFQENSRALWSFNPENKMKKKYNHPAVYPELLPYKLIQQLTYADDIVFDPFSGCYDDQTEVLTKNGWKFFIDVKKTDEFITRNPQSILEYHHPIKIHKYKYKNDLIYIKSRSTNLMVTPNHNMYLLTHNDFNLNKNPQFIQAKNLKHSLYRIPCGGIFKPTNDTLNAEQMYLIGLYLSEGYFQKERQKLSDNMIICQNQGKKNDKMKDRISSFCPVQRSDRKFRVKVGYEFQQFVLKNCGSSKYEKFISPAILSNKHLESLYEGMMDGDGCIGKGGNYKGKQYYKESYYTSSKKLVDSFQELCLKLGFETHYRFRRRWDNIIGRKVIDPHGCYDINIRKSKNKKILSKKHIYKQSYDGYVYCVTVPNHTLYVRRGGTTSWCGNSGTTCAVAKQLGRRYIGIEMSEKYHATSNQRLSEIPVIKDQQPEWIS